MKKTLLTLALVSTAFAATNAQAGYTRTLLDDSVNGSTLKVTASAKLKGKVEYKNTSEKASKKAVADKTKVVDKDGSLEYKLGFAYDQKLSDFTSVNVKLDFKGKQGVHRKFENTSVNGKFPSGKNKPLTVQTHKGDLLGPDWGAYTFKLVDTRFGTFTFSNDIDTVYSQETTASLNPGVEELKYGRGVQYESPVLNGFTFFASYNNTVARKDTTATKFDYDIKALRVKYALADTDVVKDQAVNFSYLFGHTHKAGLATPKGHQDSVLRVDSYKAAEVNYTANVSGFDLTAAYSFAVGHENYTVKKGTEHAFFLKAAYDLHQYVTLEANYGYTGTTVKENKDSKDYIGEHLFKLSYGSNSLPLVYGTSVEFGLGYEYTHSVTTSYLKGVKAKAQPKADSHKVSANVTFNLL